MLKKKAGRRRFPSAKSAGIFPLFLAFRPGGTPGLKGVTPDVIADVRARANLLEVISDVVALKRAGTKEYKGLCPFHAEKTPSFHVNPDKGIFKCFGCGEGGDVFQFVRKTKRLEFYDAVRELAQRYGVALVETEVDRRENDRRSLFLLLCEQACLYFGKLLKDSREGEVAREYLRRRGITDDTIEKFKLGYAPGSWDGLLRYLTEANKVAPDTLVEAGLARRKPESQSYYDLFRNRLIIPIVDERGRVIAFGGRTLADDQVKYLNSPETPVYHKGQTLYAFDQAREAIQERDRVIVVEGYFDAITAHQYGFTETVATLGTALTESQAKLLIRYTESKRVYLCFDSDTAGEKAVDRGMETLNGIAQGIGVSLRVIRVPGSKDPDECLRSEDEGPEAFKQAIESAPLLIDYRLERAITGHELHTHIGRIDAAKAIVPILAEIQNSIARGEYLRTWALRLGVRDEDLVSDVGEQRRRMRSGIAPDPRQAEIAKRAKLQNMPKSGYIEAERQLLALYLVSKQYFEHLRDILQEDRFIDASHQRIKEEIEGIGKFVSGQDFQLQLMDRVAADPEVSRCLVDIIYKVEEIQRQNPPLEVILKEARARILLERLNIEKPKLRIRLQQATSEEEATDLQSRILRLKHLEQNELPAVQTQNDLEQVKLKVDALLLETTA
jgi:DNA primase